MLSTKLKEAAGNSADATLYVDDVFSTYLYNGLNATQTITTGIDLATKGGLLWLKGRNVGSAYGYGDHELFDSANVGSTSKYLRSDGTDSISAGGSIAATPFTTTGFNLKAGPQVNNRAGDTTVAWTFRKAAKFFDVVTYTGDGSARTIAHSLGVAPGMVIVKRTDTTGNWQVYHRSLTSAAYSIQLNLTNAQASAPTVWNSTAPTSSVFSVGTDATVNASGGTYVAYLYAHDTSSTGIIQCGLVTVDGSGNANVNLGWQPQFAMYKMTSTANDDWRTLDTMRGFTASNGSNTNPYAVLRPNTADAEGNFTGQWQVTSTGLQLTQPGNAGQTYIYMAIRMPNKPPTTGTQVFSPNLSAATTGTPITTGFPLDLQIQQYTLFSDSNFVDRLRGVSSTSTAFGPYIRSTTTAAEVSPSNATLNVNNTGFQICAGFSGASTVYLNFKRAPGFFDEVCVTTSGYAVTANHNLGVVPELIIGKDRNGVGAWIVWNKDVAAVNSQYTLKLNTNSAQANNGMPINTVTSTTFYAAIAGASVVNQVFYLFATLAGISKVGSYTGNGTSQNIECGFAAGARFFLVKATSTTGSWWVWDSARGITSGNDPALQLNSTAAEITTADAVDPYSPGITVNQEATCSINASGVSYVYLAIS